MTHDAFKTCPRCQAVWHTRDAFLTDPAVTLAGYQVNFIEPDKGFLFFHHDCGEAVPLGVGEFRDLSLTPVFPERATGGPTCHGHCLHREDLAPCTAHCACVHVRDILQLVRAWPKAAR